MLVGLAALWGATALLNRIAAKDFSFVAIVGLRMTVASLLLCVVAWRSGRFPNLRTLHWRYLVMGLINAAIPIGLASYAATVLPTGLASILFAPTPLFSALVAYIWLKKPLTMMQLAGIMLGIVGVAVLIGVPAEPLRGAAWLGVLAAIGSCISYSLATGWVLTQLKGEAPMQVTTGQMIGSALFTLPLALANLPTQAPGWASVAIIIFFGTVSTALGFLLFFRLLARLGPTKSQVIALLIPCFGVVWGALFNSETITTAVVIGLMIVLFSVTMVTGVVPWRARLTPAVATSS